MTVVATPCKQRMARPHSSPTPSRNLEHQFRLLDHVLARSYVREVLRRRAGPSGNEYIPQVFKPRMDMCDDPAHPHIIAVLELPGLKQEDISVRIEGESLVVQGERRSPLSPWTATDPPASQTELHYKVQELKYGAFRREIVLPAGMQVGHIQASLSEGMLTLSWPRNPLAEPLTPEHAHEDPLVTDGVGGGGAVRTAGVVN